MCICVKECVDNAQTPFRGLLRNFMATWSKKHIACSVYHIQNTQQWGGLYPVDNAQAPSSGGSFAG